MSHEAVSIPPTLAAEMTAYDPTSGELRTHYALPMTNQGVKPEEAKALIEFLKKKDRDAGVVK